MFSEDQDQASGNNKLFATPFSSPPVFHSAAITSKNQIVISSCADDDTGTMLNNMDATIDNTKKGDGALSSRQCSAELGPPEVSHVRTPTITTEEAKKENRKERDRKRRQKKPSKI